jgi:phosphatidylglycerophosphate synthase
MQVRVLQVWLRSQALGWLPVLVLCAWWRADVFTAPWPGVAAIVMAAAHVALVAVLRAGRRAADMVTLLRFAGVAALLAFGGAAAADAAWSFWCAATVVVLLDLVDGAVARRFGGSEAGAVLDMETDQCTVLTLSLLVVAHGGAVHVLLLPALRYLFVLAMWFAGAPAHEPKPKNGDNRRGRRVCAAVMVALLVALLPEMPPLARDLATAVAVLLLAWSFTDDARHLVGHLRTRAVAS